MLVVGLTGGIASGKSTVSAYLRHRGALIIDADKLAREAVEPGTPALQEIVAAFGPAVLDDGGRLDRKQLAGVIFPSPRERAKLNAILHPRVISDVRALIATYKKEGKVPLVVVDAPLLLETGMQNMVDEVWVVAVPKAVQIERLMKRDGISAEEASARLAAQMPLAEKLRYAGRIINNTRSREETLADLARIWEETVDKNC